MESTSTGNLPVVQQIKHMLADDLQLRVIPDEIPDNYSLLEGGLALDSILVAELIAHIENRFGLQFADLVLDAALLEDLSALAAFVERECLAARGHGADVRPRGSSC